MILRLPKGRVTEGRLIKIEYFAATIPAQAEWLPFFCTILLFFFDFGRLCCKTGENMLYYT